MRRVAAAALLLLSACTAPAPAEHPVSPGASPDVRARIASIRSYVVYYGAGRLDDLARFDLAIIDP